MGILSAIGTGIGSFFGGPLGAVAGSAIGSGVDYLFGQSSAKQAQGASNKAMLQQQQLNTANYKTRYQWTTEDMKKAGLNPILAATGGFNVGNAPSVSLPSMPMGTTGRTYPISSSAKDFQQANTEKVKRNNLNSQIQLNLNNGVKAIAQAAKEMAQAGKLTVEKKIALKNINKIQWEIQNLQQQHMNLAAQRDKTEQEIMNLQSARSNTIQQTRNLNRQNLILYEERKRLNALTAKLKAEIPKLRTEARVFSTGFGQLMTAIRLLRESIGLSLSGVGGAVKAAIH